MGAAEAHVQNRGYPGLMVLDHPIDPRDDTGRGAATQTVEDTNRYEPGRARDSVRDSGHRAGHVRAVSVAVVAVASDGEHVVTGQQPTRELGVTQVDAGVDDVDRDPSTPPCVDGERRVEWQGALVDPVEAPRRW